MINELRDLYKWGNKHYTHYMTIPEIYIGHKEFLELGIIQEYYPINNYESAEKWIKEGVWKTWKTPQALPPAHLRGLPDRAAQALADPSGPSGGRSAGGSHWQTGWKRCVPA